MVIYQLILEIKTFNQFQSEINSDGKVVVKFWATWCVPCRTFASHYERAAGELINIKFLSVDVDDVPEVVVGYKVQSVPTVMLFENGEFVTNIKAPQGSLPLINNIQSA